MDLVCENESERVEIGGPRWEGGRAKRTRLLRREGQGFRSVREGQWGGAS
jgi:hypothetical protein